MGTSGASSSRREPRGEAGPGEPAGAQHPRPRDPARWRRIAKIALVNLGLVLALLAGANLIAALLIDLQGIIERNVLPGDPRADLPSYSDHDRARQILGEFRQLSTRYEPFVEWVRDEFHGATTTVDADGERRHPATTDHPRGTVRFFGGSTMWGSGSDDEGTIPALFNQMHRDYEVRNHGESGYTSRQSISRLVNLVNQGEPMDLVVFYDGNNDVGTFCRPDVAINGHTRVDRIRSAVNPPSFVWADLTGSLKEALGGKFVQKLFFGEGLVRTRCHEDPAYARRVAETMVKNWKIARAIAHEGGAEFLAILQPIASMGNPTRDHLKPDEISPEREQNLVYPYVREILARENATWALDFTTALDGKGYAFIDECHLTAEGNRAIAERLDQTAAPLLRAREERSAAKTTPPEGDPGGSWGARG